MGFYYYWRALERIEQKLDVIMLMEGKIMADEAALDAAISELGGNVSNLLSASQAIIDKVSGMDNAPDLTDEIATIQGFSQKLNETTAAISEALVPAVVPTPEEPPPVEEAPPTEEPT